MTLCNINFGQARAYVVSDTLSFHGPEQVPCAFHTKCRILPHLRAVYVVRGSTSVFFAAQEWLELKYCPNGVAASIARLSDCLIKYRVGIEETRIRERREKGRSPIDGPQEIWVVGYDGVERRFRAWHLLDESGFQVRELEPGTYLSPEFGVEPPVRIKAMAQTMAKIAVLQKRMREENARVHGGLTGIGGEVFMVEMRPRRIEVTKIHTFADFDLAKQQVEAWAGP